MLRRVVLILICLTTYVYLVSSDPGGSLYGKAKSFCNHCYIRYKKMNLEYHVNKFPSKEKKQRRY